VEVEAMDPARWRTEVETTAEVGMGDVPLLTLAILTTDSLNEEDLEEVDRRDARRERVAAVI